MLLSFYTSAVENGWFEVRSKFLKMEIEKSEVKVMKSGQTRMDHTSGAHNDRLFASALSFWTMHDAECLAAWSKRKYNSGANVPLAIDFSPSSTLVNVGGENLWGIR